MIKSSYFRFFFALCLSVSLLACSEDKAAPSHAELCSATPATKECLTGNWAFEGIEGDFSCNADRGNLDLQADGGFHFTGGQHNSDIWGRWTFDNPPNISAFDIDLNETFTGSVSVTDNGDRMRVTSSGKEAVFSHCNSGQVGGIEKFRWNGH